jgi:hypothetical protein
MALLRLGGMSQLFTGIRAPPRWGRSCGAPPYGHGRQFDAIASGLPAWFVGLRS